MRMLLALLLFLASDVSAQSKPIGLYDPGQNPPSWASFGTLADFYPDADYIAARTLSEQRGFRWVLHVGHGEPIEQPLGAHAQRVLARLDATGLRPYVIAVDVREEWYEVWQQGAFAALGLPPEHPHGVSIIKDWAGQQHKAVKDVLGLPVVWVTTRVSPSRPVPAHTDYVAVDAYVPMGGSFARDVAPALADAERYTHLPLVQIPQWFTGQGWSVPTVETLADYARWAQRPRWIAVLGFTWRDRPTADLVGLESLHGLRAVIDHHMGSR